MATYGLDVECPHIFDGTHFARWRNWMQCNFKFISPQMWWLVDVGLSFAIDRKNATSSQSNCLYLDHQATNVFYRSIDSNIYNEIWELKSAHEIWMFLNEKYGGIPNDDEDIGEHKNVDAHEGVEHDHNMVVVEDCSTSWSSEDDDDSTSSPLDKMEDGATSDEGSCSDCDATTSPSSTPHCFMSQGDTKVENDNVVDHVDSYDELVSRLASMIMTLENEKIKTMELEKRKLISKEIK